VLPFFHSFGFTVTLWSVLGLDVQGVYHYNPLDAKVIGKLCQEHHVTVLMTTATFLRTYLRRCQREEFATVDVVVAGAEKLPRELANVFEEKMGVRPVEGYGTTELSPLVSVNIPPSRAPRNGDNLGLKEGSVGRPVPGVSAKVIHAETGEDLGVDQPGLLLIKGPNVMQGYLNQPELTAEVIRDGWYVTGDVAFIDAEGFIHITGRKSRFSKIGGEMVPHIRIEEALQQILSPDEQKLTVAVTALPDERKGERLIVLHTALDKSPEQIVKELSAAGLPNLWIPAADAFYQVNEIPVLGTGKLDLQAVKQLAQEKASTPSPSG
jgi:acyl-[acyl-carrier-protein]-phospholipid O-acyltransferase/long-chain-fatty-acid--[acyl-carrier-protein] ligase